MFDFVWVDEVGQRGRGERALFSVLQVGKRSEQEYGGRRAAPRLL